MAVKQREIDHGWDKIQKELKVLKNAKTKVGYFGDGGTDPSKNVAALAAIQEHGIDIKVTKKMKGYFLYKFGVSLKKKVIHIPSRPWNRMTFDKYKNHIKKILAHEYDQVLKGKQSAKKAIAKVGEWYTGQLKTTLTKGNFIPNSELTIREKGSSKPLISGGTMRNSTTHREFFK